MQGRIVKSGGPELAQRLEAEGYDWIKEELGGAGGLGHLAFLEGFQRNNSAIMVVATITILILVFIIQAIGDVLTNKLDKR